MNIITLNEFESLYSYSATPIFTEFLNDPNPYTTPHFIELSKEPKNFEGLNDFIKSISRILEYNSIVKLNFKAINTFVEEMEFLQSKNVLSSNLIDVEKIKYFYMNQEIDEKKQEIDGFFVNGKYYLFDSEKISFSGIYSGGALYLFMLCIFLFKISIYQHPILLNCMRQCDYNNQLQLLLNEYAVSDELLEYETYDVSLIQRFMNDKIILF